MVRSLCVFCWALVLWLPIQATPATVFVESSTSASDLVELLKEELPASAYVETATRADLRARLSPDHRLTIVDAAGNTLLDRSLKGEHDVAVRVAALLIIEAQQSRRDLPEAREQPRPVSARVPEIAALPEPRVLTASIAPPDKWSFGATLGAGFGAWSSDAQLAIQGSAYARYGAFELAAVLSSTGRGCACALRTESLRVEPEATALAAEARWWWWRPLAVLETSLWLASGYQWETAASRVIGGFAARGLLETKRFDSWIVRGGASVAAAPFESLFVRGDFGVHLQRELRVSLPPFEEYRGVPGGEVKRAVVGPWAVLSVGLSL